MAEIQSLINFSASIYTTIGAGQSRGSDLKKPIPESEFMERMEFSATETQVPRPLPSTKMKNKNKQRFNDDQIRLLESMFESDTKLEPRKKEAVAGELGLQPRQVAIWFQNRRARGKSKQIEQELRILQANYDSLVSQFEILKEEKKALLAQKLNSMADNPHCGSSTNEDQQDSRARHGLQEELGEAEMEHPHDFQSRDIMKWIEDEGCETEAMNPDEHEEQRSYNTLVDEERRQLWGTQRMNSSLSFENSGCSSEWLYFWS